MIPARLSDRHPRLLPWAVRLHQLRRHLRWRLPGTDWARGRTRAALPFVAVEHRSPLLRRLSPEQMRWQHHKVVNLRLACARVDGLVIGPGETWSFNRAVGSCTARRGYLDGMRLHDGQVVTGVGGGVCQLANLLHWMFLHTTLTVTERSEHSFDPFPDHERVLPWGVGCSIAYNYVDLVVRNDGPLTFQLRVRVGDEHLVGELRADRPAAAAYVVEARAEEFLRVPDGRVYRRNDIWRTALTPDSRTVLGEERIRRNCAVVRYPPPADRVVDVDELPRAPA